MAEIRVEPKKKTNYLVWVLLLLGLIAVAVFMVRRTDEAQPTARSGARTNRTEAQPPAAAVAATGVETISSVDGWGNVDRYGKSLDYPELHANKKVRVRGNEHYAVYDLGEDVLFDKGKSVIRSDADAQLKAIAASLDQHFRGGPIRLFGFADAQGDASFNKELAQARAEAVKDWLIRKANIKSERVTTEAVGEASPKATNKTDAGRRENRRVQIVVKESTNNK